MNTSEKLVHIGLAIVFGLASAFQFAIGIHAPLGMKVVFILGSACSLLFSLLLGAIAVFNAWLDFKDRRN